MRWKGRLSGAREVEIPEEGDADPELAARRGEPRCDGAGETLVQLGPEGPRPRRRASDARRPDYGGAVETQRADGAWRRRRIVEDGDDVVLREPHDERADAELPAAS